MKSILINYSGSGIKTLRIMAWIILATSVLSFFVFITKCIGYGDHTFEFLTAIGSLVFGISFLLPSLVLATIAENALYQKSKLIAECRENEIDIKIEN